MKLRLAVICILLAAFQAAGQSYLIGHSSVLFQDTIRNRSVTAEIYYPADSTGDDVPLANQLQAAPVIVFGHGFVMTWSAYSNIWNALVPEGYIVAFPTTETGVSPSHLMFAADIAFLVTAIQREGLNLSSPFYSKVASTSCLMGHSMGGGACFLSYQYNPGITAMAVLAPAETGPSAIAAAQTIMAPSLIVAGANDCVTPPNTNQVPMYAALPASCKTYLSITGGSHCQMAETNALCSFGEATCLPGPTITRSVQHAIINRYLVPWLNYQLKNDCAQGALFDSRLVSDSQVTYQRTCNLCTGTETVTVSGSPFSVRPNPFRDVFEIGMEGDYGDGWQIAVYDMYGALVYSGERVISRVAKIDSSGWPAGYYSVIIRRDDGVVRCVRLVKVS